MSGESKLNSETKETKKERKFYWIKQQFSGKGEKWGILKKTYVN